jgi:arginine/serine-rich splicing factor 12
VTLDGDAIRGSPFPVFFAAPPASNVPANPMTASAVAGVAAARPPTAAAVQPAMRYPPPPPPPAALDEMQRTLCVKNIGAMVGVEQLRALFGYCGDVVDCRVAGSGAQYGFVEFATNAQAVKALGLDGMALGDRTIKVEMSRTARMNAPAAAPRGPNLVVPPPPPPTSGAAPTAPAAAAASDVHQKRLADAEKTQAALLAKMAAERAAKVAAKVAAKKRAREAEAAERENGAGGEVKVPREADEATTGKPEDDAEVGSAKRSRGGEGDQR